MLDAVITQKGQITIPVSIRRLLGLEPADRLVFGVEKQKIIATPVKKDIMSLYGSIKTDKKTPYLKKLRREMVQAVAKKIVKESS